MQSLTEKVFDVPKLKKLIEDCQHLNNPETHTNQEKDASLLRENIELMRGFYAKVALYAPWFYELENLAFETYHGTHLAHTFSWWTRYVANCNLFPKFLSISKFVIE